MIAVCAMIDGAKGPTFGVASLRKCGGAASCAEDGDFSILPSISIHDGPTRNQMYKTHIPEEEKSAAATLSDMEIFIFPELMYSLVLANILSPRLWRWRDLEWFDGIREMRPKKRLQRLRQHIMDNYTFNLDLETWGLTNQARELERFAPFLDPDEIAASNALFGYHGDAYYYDIDIRRHFGLDKYSSDVIPYWKTETVEAMDAFRRKEGHAVGAGECVSLAGLYAAAAFVVCGIPLESIYLMATPLHSQNFIDVDTGILTNNRRLVTRAMWSNGTVISQQARRALEHERVTIVSHATGYIHLLYPDATIAPAAYSHFADESIYDGTSRLAQPDEVWNFGTGDGLEKCLLAANVLGGTEIRVGGGCAALMDGERAVCTFPTAKRPLVNRLPCA